ncbi:unnamed protein product, partial [Rhizoctonia solani]
MSAASNRRYTTIRQWEDAGASLVTAIGDYMDLCLTLTPNHLGEDIKTNDIAARIDPTIKAVFEQLTKLGPTALKMRNKLVSPLLQLPEEIISMIFQHYIFDPDNPKSPRTSSMIRDVRGIHYRLDALIQVCSSWKDIVMAKGLFWSVTPVLYGFFSLECTLKRAGQSKLYLAAADDIVETPKLLPQVLAEYGSRFWAINIEVRDSHLIKGAMRQISRQGTTGSLTELSIRWDKAHNASPALPTDEFDYIFPRSHSEQTSFTNMMGLLTAFRISGIQFHWDTIVFSTRLVELRIDNITLGYDDAIVSFLRALSSASELRDLKLISVATLHRPSAALNTGTPAPIEFPKLQSLLLQNMYFNALKLLLPAFTRARHCLTLFLTGLCLKVNMLEGDRLEGGQEQQSELDRATNLCATLRPLSLDTLTLGESNLATVWLRGKAFHILLEGLPTLKTLKLHKWIFEAWDWQHLTRPRSAQENPEEHPFAALQNLYIISASIRTFRLDYFQEMIISHPLQRVVLGGVSQRLTSTRTYEKSLEDSECVEWTRNNVPEF